MFKTHENQVIAVFIEDRIYTCLKGNFPIQPFREFLYGYIDPDSDGEINLIYQGKEIDPETFELDLSDGSPYQFDVLFTDKSGNLTFDDYVELFAISVIQP
jgi:hypothetical protein